MQPSFLSAAIDNELLSVHQHPTTASDLSYRYTIMAEDTGRAHEAQITWDGTEPRIEIQAADGGVPDERVEERILEIARTSGALIRSQNRNAALGRKPANPPAGAIWTRISSPHQISLNIAHIPCSQSVFSLISHCVMSQHFSLRFSLRAGSEPSQNQRSHSARPLHSSKLSRTPARTCLINTVYRI